jgi:hypothetical protein
MYQNVSKKDWIGGTNSTDREMRNAYRSYSESLKVRDHIGDSIHLIKCLLHPIYTIVVGLDGVHSAL